MKKLKILQTPARCYPYIGGVEKYVLDLSKQLVKSGHSVKIICAREPSTKIKSINGVKIKKLLYIFKIANTNITPALFFSLIKEDFDIIHTHYPTPWSADISMVVSLIKRKPLIITYHNDVIKEGIQGLIANIYQSTFLKLCLMRAKKILITEPGYIKKSRYLQKYHKKIEVIPNGVNMDIFETQKHYQTDNKIFFLSVLDKHHKYKGLDNLLQAVKIIKNSIPNVKLMIGGRGELVDYYRNMTIKLGIEGNVKFLGYLNDDDIVKKYEECNVFVLSSINEMEGFGIVLLEAMACYKPVVTTTQVGIWKDIKEHNTGIIVKPNNVLELSTAIIKLLENKRLSTEMGNNGRKLVDIKYNWNKIVHKVEKIYSEAVL